MKRLSRSPRTQPGGATRWRWGAGRRQGWDVNRAEEESAQGCTRWGVCVCVCVHGQGGVSSVEDIRQGNSFLGTCAQARCPSAPGAPKGKSSVAGPHLHTAHPSTPVRLGLRIPAGATARHRAPKSSHPSPAFSLTHSTKAISYRPCPRPRASLPATASIRQGTRREPPR